MSKDELNDVREVVDAVYRSESRQVLATLIRLLGDFETAEEALHEAFAIAVEQWARDGVPANPRAWLVSTGRFKAIDGMRRRARHDASVAEMAKQPEPTTTLDVNEQNDESVEDNRHGTGEAHSRTGLHGTHWLCRTDHAEALAGC